MTRVLPPARQWRVSTLGEECQILAGFGFPERLQGKKDGDLPFFKVGDISEAWKRNEPALTRANHYVSLDEAKEIRAKPLPAGTTVFAKIGAAIALNRRAILSEPSLVDNNVFGLVPHPDALLPRFLFHYVCTLRFGDSSRATTVPSLRKSDVAGIPIPIPPLDVQVQIVEEIEQQLTRLDAGITALKRVQANLKRYRAAVLKAACEGRLVPTEAGLARHEGRPFEPASALLERIQLAHAKNRPGVTRPASLRQHPRPAVPSQLTELPEGWSWTTLGELSPADRPSAYGILQPGPHAAGGTPIVRVGDIEGGRLETKTLKRVAPTVAARYPRTKLQGGEVVLTIVGTIGRAAVVPPTLTGANTARAVAVVPLCPGVHPEWVVAWLNSPVVGAALAAKAHEVARKTLNLEDVRYAAIALPPQSEQRRIIAEVDRLLSLADDLETVVSTSGARGARLRRALLAAAFGGPLNLAVCVSLGAAGADSP